MLKKACQDENICIYFQMEFPIYRKKRRMLDGANTEEMQRGLFLPWLEDNSASRGDTLRKRPCSQGHTCLRGAPDVILKKSGMNSSRTPPKITSLTFSQTIQAKKPRGRLRNVFRIKETKDKYLLDVMVMLGHFLDSEKPVLEQPPLTHSTNLNILCIDENN